MPKDSPPAMYPTVEFAPPDAPQPPVSDIAQKLYADVQPSIARISGAQTQLGTGFAIDGAGKMATAYHVVRDSREIFAEINGKKHRMKLSDFDDERDVAILTPVTTFATKPLEMGSSKSTKIDDDLYAFGHPLGLPKLYVSPGRSEGIASLAELLKSTGAANDTTIAKGLSTQPELRQGIEAHLNRPLITAFMQCQPGNSGGPVTDSTGRVVGVTDQVIPTDQSTQLCPIEDVKTLLEKPKFQVTYERGFDSPLAKWAEQQPAMALGAGAGYVGLGAFSARAAYRGPISARTLGVGSMLIGGSLLYDDAKAYGQKADLSSMDAWRSTAELSSDALLVAGGAALTFGGSRLRVLGLSAVGLGAIGRTGSEFIPTAFKTSDIYRVDGSSRPILPEISLR